jgi:hypothetical protein
MSHQCLLKVHVYPIFCVLLNTIWKHQRLYRFIWTVILQKLITVEKIWQKRGGYHCQKWYKIQTNRCTAGLSNTAPVIYFPGTLIYFAGFNVNQNFNKKYIWITVCLNLFRSTPMNTVFPLLQSCFLLYPFYCLLTPPFPFLLEKAPASQVIPSNK